MAVRIGKNGPNALTRASIIPADPSKLFKSEPTPRFSNKAPTTVTTISTKVPTKPRTVDTI